MPQMKLCHVVFWCPAIACPALPALSTLPALPACLPCLLPALPALHAMPALPAVCCLPVCLPAGDWGLNYDRV